MDGNLLLEYDRFVEYCKKEYLESYKTLTKTQAFKRLTSQMKFVDIIKFYRSWNALSGGLPESIRRGLMEIATEEEKQEPFFNLMISDYQLDYFATKVMKKFPNVDFAKLKQVHELKKAQMVRSNFLPRVVGGVLAVGTLLLKSIPESVVARVIDYAEYEYYVFWLMVVVIVYLSVLVLPIWFKFNEANSTLGSIEDVLTYVTIKKGE